MLDICTCSLLGANVVLLIYRIIRYVRTCLLQGSCTQIDTLSASLCVKGKTS